MWGELARFVLHNAGEIAAGALAVYSWITGKRTRKEKLRAIALEVLRRTDRIAQREGWTWADEWRAFGGEFFAELSERNVKLPTEGEYKIVRQIVEAARRRPDQLSERPLEDRARERLRRLSEAPPPSKEGAEQ